MDYDDEKAWLRAIESKYIRKTGQADGHLQTIEEDIIFLYNYACETTKQLNNLLNAYSKLKKQSSPSDASPKEKEAVK